MLNVAAVEGRLVADPQLRQTMTGKNVAAFRLACDRGRKNADGNNAVDWIDIVAWEKKADFAARYLTKGQLIAVSGRIQTRQYQDRNGNNRQAVEIVANTIDFCESKRQAAPTVDEGGYAAPAGAQDPAPSYNAAAGYQGPNEDFALIEDEGDLPF